jgi:hypothetical protein
VNCTDTFAEGDEGAKVNEATGLDDGEGEDDDEDESPQAETARVPIMMMTAASRVRPSDLCVLVTGAS